MLSLLLRDFLHHGILHPVLKGLVVLLRSNRTGSALRRSAVICLASGLVKSRNPSATPTRIFSTTLAFVDASQY